jgi:integrase
MSKGASGMGYVSTKARADGLWVAQYTHVVDGKVHRPVLYGRTRAEAARKLREALIARDNGERPAPAKQSVAEYLRSWHEGSRPQLRERSWMRQGEHVRLHLVPTLGHVPLRKLSPEQVQRAYAQLLARNLSPATVRRAHAVLHRALGQAVRWRLLPVNVASMVDAPRIPHREMQALTSEQARELLEAARGSRHRDEPLLVLAVSTGMRLGELLALRWKDVDLEQRFLRVTGSLVRVESTTVDSTELVITEPKTARSRRRVELTHRAVEALREHKRAQLKRRVAAANVWQDRGLVFSNATGGYLAANKLQARFQQLLEDAGLPRIRFHDLRHTAASLMLSRGVHPKVAADMLGHSTIAVTLDLYSHVSPAMQREAVAALDDILR